MSPCGINILPQRLRTEALRHMLGVGGLSAAADRLRVTQSTYGPGVTGNSFMWTWKRKGKFSHHLHYWNSAGERLWNIQQVLPDKALFLHIIVVNIFTVTNRNRSQRRELLAHSNANAPSYCFPVVNANKLTHNWSPDNKVTQSYRDDGWLIFT